MRKSDVLSPLVHRRSTTNIKIITAPNLIKTDISPKTGNLTIVSVPTVNLERAMRPTYKTGSQEAPQNETGEVRRRSFPWLLGQRGTHVGKE